MALEGSRPEDPPHQAPAEQTDELDNRGNDREQDERIGAPGDNPQEKEDRQASAEEQQRQDNQAGQRFSFSFTNHGVLLSSDSVAIYEILT